MTVGSGTQTRSHTCISLGCTSTADCQEKCADGFQPITHIGSSTKFCANLTKDVRGDEAFDLCNDMSGYMPDPLSRSQLDNFCEYYAATRGVYQGAVLGSFSGFFWLGAERRPIDAGSPEHRWFWFTTGAQNGDLK